MIRVMVADDEPLAQEEIIRLIEENQDFKVVSRASNGAAALEEMKANPVDVVFLDIEMPEMDGLEVASQLATWENPPIVVFATAYHQYAIEAFEANAIDYILKPYDPVRLKKALERVKGEVERKEPEREKLISLEDDLIRKGVLKKIVGHEKNKKDRVIIHPEEVHFFKVQFSEIIVHLDQGEYIINTTLKELLATLDAESFAQTHKSYVVNINKIEKVSPLFSGNFEITMKHLALPKVPLSRRYAKSLKTRLGNW